MSFFVFVEGFGFILDDNIVEIGGKDSKLSSFFSFRRLVTHSNNNTDEVCTYYSLCSLHRNLNEIRIQMSSH